MNNARTRVRQNARFHYEARWGRRNGTRRDVNPYAADSLARLAEIDGLSTDTNRCGHCNAKAEHPHDGGCRTTLTWRWHECVVLDIRWQGWVLQFASGRRLAYVMRQAVPTPDGMKARWVPFTWDGAQLAGPSVHPQTARAAIERRTGVESCPVNY